MTDRSIIYCQYTKKKKNVPVWSKNVSISSVRLKWKILTRLLIVAKITLAKRYLKKLRHRKS